jgi:rubrerythrin
MSRYESHSPGWHARAVEDAVLDAHLDELRHPDPAGTGLSCLLQSIQAHIRTEVTSVATYARLQQQANDPVIAAVLELLVQDETRHHALLERIARTIHDQLNWATEKPPAAAAPAITAEEVRALELDERREADELHRLSQVARGSDSELCGLLLESMAIDSDKHARLLSFVAQRLEHRKACKS